MTHALAPVNPVRPSRRQPRRQVPSYRPHKTGQAVVTLNGKDIYLGRYDTPESRQAYDRTIAAWLARGTRLLDAAVAELTSQG